eukprot:4691-Rhodomonas_salina.1
MCIRDRTPPSLNPPAPPLSLSTDHPGAACAQGPAESALMGVRGPGARVDCSGLTRRACRSRSIYTVERGDSLLDLAALFQTTVIQVLRPWDSDASASILLLATLVPCRPARGEPGPRAHQQPFPPAPARTGWSDRLRRVLSVCHARCWPQQLLLSCRVVACSLALWRSILLALVSCLFVSCLLSVVYAMHGAAGRARVCMRCAVLNVERVCVCDAMC